MTAKTFIMLQKMSISN